MTTSQGNLTALNEDVYRGWMTPPATRGTSDILYTCITTIVLCVYTAVHLNIPPPGEKPQRQYLRQAKWTIIGIFAPEIVLFNAWSQYREASRLVRELRAIPPKMTAPTDQVPAQENTTAAASAPASASHTISLRYGFYAIMGGFRVDVQEFSDTMVTAALSPHAIIQLAKAGIDCHIDLATIEDKSKANNLAKVLVIFQVSWMLVQCVARKISGLPLSLLEIHTFIHAICAAIMYAFWFKKPHNVGEATLIQVPDTLGHLLAELIIYSKAEHLVVLKDDLTPNVSVLIPEHCFRYCQERRLQAMSKRLSLKEVIPKGRRMPHCPLYYYRTTNPNLSLQPVQFWVDLGTSANYFPRGHVEISVSSKMTKNALAASLRHCMTLTETEENMYQKRGSLATRVENLATNFDHDTWMPDDSKFNIIVDRFVTLGQSLEVTFSLGSLSPGLTAILLQAVYGGVHLSAWTAVFPSDAERLLWKIACLIVTLFMPAVYVVLVYLALHRQMFPVYTSHSWSNALSRKGMVRVLRNFLEMVLPLCFGLELFLLLTAAVVARSYIVIESLISLRAVPAGVYKAIEWADYIPHL